MRTIYLKRNFLFVLITTSILVSSLYLADYYFYQNVKNPPVTNLSLTFDNNNNKTLSPRSFVMKSKSVVVVQKGQKISSKIPYKKNKAPPPSKSKCPVTVVLILCEVPQYLTLKNTQNQPQTHKPIAKDFSRQINQTLVMLKSIALQTKYFYDNPQVSKVKGEAECVSVLIISDKKINFDNIVNKIKVEWGEQFQRSLNLSYIPLKYPKGTEWMRKMFRPCATLRLFLPEILPTHFDNILYLDTDVIFLNSVQSLVDNYFNSNRIQGKLAAMAPCLFHYGTPANSVPYYGTSGLNAGLMLMNLSGMRDSMWTNKIRLITSMYQDQIKLADQDIVNIYFHFFPEELVPLTCDWNFRAFQCRGDENYCQDIEIVEGISALHGNALSFTPIGSEPLFHTVFQAFHQLELTDNFNLELFSEELESRLLQAEETFHSDCVKYGAFTVLVLNRFDKLLNYISQREARKESNGNEQIS